MDSFFTVRINEQGRVRRAIAQRAGREIRAAGEGPRRGRPGRKRLGAGVGAGASVSYDEVGRTRELLLTRIALYGYTMTQVIPTREWSGPAYTYTIGLPQHIGHPELAVCGLSPKASIRVITSVVGLLEETPEAEGRVVGAFANDVPYWIAPIPDRMVDSYLGLAEWWRRDHHDGATARRRDGHSEADHRLRSHRPLPVGARLPSRLPDRAVPAAPADHRARAEHHRHQPAGRRQCDRLTPSQRARSGAVAPHRGL